MPSKSSTSKDGAKKKEVAKKVTGQKTKAATAAKKTTASAAKKVSSASWVGDQDLFIEIDGKVTPLANQFKSQISPIYNVEEFYWIGKIKPQSKIRFVRGNGSEIPVHADFNHGYALIGKAMESFFVDEALVVNSEFNDCKYVYVNPKSALSYVGDNKEHTIYVRVYDNAHGNYNDRWLTISIE